MCAEFRQGLSARGLTWAVGILPTQKGSPRTVRLRRPRRPPTGRPPTHPGPSAPRVSVQALIHRLGPRAFRRLTWRRGTKGPLRAEFAAVRVRVADGVRLARGEPLPGEEVWLVCEQRASGEQQDFLTNHPAAASRRTLARAIKARWVCEQAHQQLKDELGLDHFEGRSWRRLPHHALLTMIAFAFLQHPRLGGKPATPPAGARPAAGPLAARGAPSPARQARRRPALSALPHPLPLRPPRMKVAK